MADLFSNCDTKTLLKNKHILFMGDSNTRALYKDMVWLLNHNTLIGQNHLRSKLEESYLGDTLVERSRLHYGRDFQEVRHYYDRKNDTTVDFTFLTRCYNHHLQGLFGGFKRKTKKIPDIIVMNSCLWDLTRWGPNGVPEYKDNMVKLMRLMSQSLPKECLVIWTTALPTAPHVRGGLLIKQIEFIEPMLRFEVMEANTFAREIVVSHGFDVLDNHYHTRMQMHRRAKDGVHYLPIPVRFLTNLLLTHIALTWDRKLPNKVHSVLLDKAIAMDSKPVEKQPEVKMPTTKGIFSKIKLESPKVSRTKGLTITFDPQERVRRQCNLFENEIPDVSACQQEEDWPRPKSVVQVVQCNQQQQQHSMAGPSRKRKRNRAKKHLHYEPYHCNRYHSQY